MSDPNKEPRACDCTWHDMVNEFWLKELRALEISMLSDKKYVELSKRCDDLERNFLALGSVVERLLLALKETRRPWWHW